MTLSTFWVAFTVFFILLLCESYFSWKFLRGLQKSHELHWELIGKRNIWTDSGLITAWPTIRFLLSRHYLQVDDDDGIAFCKRYRWPVIVSYFAAALAAVGFLAVAIVIVGTKAFSG